VLLPTSAAHDNNAEAQLPRKPAHNQGRSDRQHWPPAAPRSLLLTQASCNTTHLCMIRVQKITQN
jgi:hypothetical protein